MKDYQKLKLIASAGPHIRGPENTRAIMLHVIIAMLPALAFAGYWFGLRAVAVAGVSAAACVFWEFLYRLLLRKPQSVGDLSAVVTGMLLAFVCPADVAYWQIALGAFFAIVIAKQLYGGIGKNFINPALAGHAFMLVSFAAVTGGELPAGVSEDAVTAAAPLGYLKGADIAASFRALTEEYTLLDMVLGRTGGLLGEVCTLALLAGGAYLIGRKVITWHAPVSFLVTVAALTLLFPRGDAERLQWMLYSLCSGGLVLGAFFMATDYTTSPITKRGKVLYGMGCGLLTVFIRYFGACEEGVFYAIMVMNCVTPIIDKRMRPRRFGAAGVAKRRHAE